MPDNAKKETEFGNQVFRGMFFFYFLAINTLRVSSKCFVYECQAGDKPTFHYSPSLLGITVKHCRKDNTSMPADFLKRN